MGIMIGRPQWLHGTVVSGARSPGMNTLVSHLPLVTIRKGLSLMLVSLIHSTTIGLRYKLRGSMSCQFHDRLRVVSLYPFVTRPSKVKPLSPSMAAALMLGEAMLGNRALARGLLRGLSRAARLEGKDVLQLQLR